MNGDDSGVPDEKRKLLGFTDNRQDAALQAGHFNDFLFVSLLRMLWRLKRMNVLWRRYKTFLINENRWRAMRYGIDQGLIDFGKVAMVPYADLLEELLVMTEEDAAALGCTAEVAHARTILTTGTSAHAQVRVYEEAVAAGAEKKEALQAVVDWLIEETKRGA